jgi:hypothetical protein
MNDQDRGLFSGLRPSRPALPLRESVLRASTAAARQDEERLAATQDARARRGRGPLGVGWVWATSVALLLALHALLSAESAVDRRSSRVATSQVVRTPIEITPMNLAVVGRRGASLGEEESANWRLLSLTRVDAMPWP